MTWKEIRAAARELLIALNKTKDSLGYFKTNIEFKGKNAESGRHTIFFPITQTVGIKILPLGWDVSPEKTVMYTAALAAEKMAAPLYLVEKFPQYNMWVMYVGVGKNLDIEYSCHEDEDDVFENYILDNYHKRAKQMLRFMRERWRKLPEFAEDYCVGNLGLYAGKLVYFDTNVSNGG